MDDSSMVLGEPIESVGLDCFRTQKHIMAGTWNALPTGSKKEHIRILIREAHKTKYTEGFMFVREI